MLHNERYGFNIALNKRGFLMNLDQKYLKLKWCRLKYKNAIRTRNQIKKPFSLEEQLRLRPH